MDALNRIAIAMTAMVFIWVGYFLGIVFPTFGKSKQLQMERKARGEKLIDFKALGQRASGTEKKIDLSFISRAWKKVVDWLLEREPEDVPEPVEAVQPEEEHAPISEQAPLAPPPAAPVPASSDQQSVAIPAALKIPEEAVLLWHDRVNKKLFARIGKDVVDLDTDLSKSQHGTLSMLLVDLQDRVGISATLKAALSEGTEQVYAEKERQDKIASLPAEEELKGPSFNPVKSFLDYVRADVPKLEEKPDSIPTQINNILQEMIAGTPLKDKGLSVADWPNRGVVFIVGIDIYSAIDEIPDENIRKVIQLAVKKWEQTQEEKE